MSDTNNTAAGEAKADAMWTQEPPTEGGEYWHWNGDRDCAPLPTFVMYSGTTGKCFVTTGQLGLSHPVDCDQYGGWWLRMHAPKLPDAAALSPATPPAATPGAPSSAAESVGEGTAGGVQHGASMTYGDLPKSVSEVVEPHKWDNMNVSEQRDWAVKALAGALILADWWAHRPMDFDSLCNIALGQQQPAPSPDADEVQRLPDGVLCRAPGGQTNDECHMVYVRGFKDPGGPKCAFCGRTQSEYGAAKAALAASRDAGESK